MGFDVNLTDEVDSLGWSASVLFLLLTDSGEDFIDKFSDFRSSFRLELATLLFEEDILNESAVNLSEQ
jgi:hypothetical protein